MIGMAATTIISCAPAKNEYASYELYPVRSANLTEMEYTPAATQFTLWSPTADEVRLMLFEAGEGGHAYETVSMKPSKEGTWTAAVEKDLKDKFYTFNVKINDKWLGDTPGINAKAVGVNGKRAAIIDMKSTDPEGWAKIDARHWLLRLMSLSMRCTIVISLLTRRQVWNIKESTWHLQNLAR